ncbi:hypothetical protein EI94DRAFT_1875857 [Lactarius quietus]|nr:hypothetical protein EI94DRAFT_1875857 [Lactarius quietus]
MPRCPLPRATFHHANPPVGSSYSLCTPSYLSPSLRHFRSSLPPSAPEGTLPCCGGYSGHQLFISAFMLASKIICDDTYSNKSWCIVGQGLFALREIN